MRTILAVLVITLFSTCTPAQSSAPSAPVTEGNTSAVLRPALDSIRQTVPMLKVDKWKLSGALKDEMQGDIQSITNDLDGTLPQLLQVADAPPVLMSHVLPATRNIDALYNVLLRVTATAKVAAPSEQSAALENAVSQLQQAKQALEGRILKQASALEQRVLDSQTALKASQDALAKAKADAAAAADAAKKTTRTKKKSTHKSSQ